MRRSLSALGHGDDLVRASALRVAPVAEQQQVVRGEVQTLRARIACSEDMLIEYFVEARHRNAQGGGGFLLVVNPVSRDSAQSRHSGAVQCSCNVCSWFRPPSISGKLLISQSR